jgi:hypothetical protein
VYQLLNREEAEAPSTTPVKLNGVTRDYPRQSASDPLQIDAPIESEEQKEEEAANAQSLPVSHLIDSYIAVEPTTNHRGRRTCPIGKVTSMSHCRPLKNTLIRSIFGT